MYKTHQLFIILIYNCYIAVLINLVAKPYDLPKLTF
jgi:hypothetical protein